MWVVLRFENQYDQYGAYFVGIFETEEACQSPIGYFGRKSSKDNTWYERRQIEINQLYGEDHIIHKYFSSIAFL